MHKPAPRPASGLPERRGTIRRDRLRTPISLGIDIVEIDRFKRLCARGLLGRVFNRGEMGGGAARASVKRAACVFAAKEAIFKALGRGWGQGGRWRDLLVSRDSSGRWCASLRGDARERLDELGGEGVLLDVSTDGKRALAQAIIYPACPAKTGTQRQ